MVGMGAFFVAFLLVVGVCTKVHAFSGKKNAFLCTLLFISVGKT